MWESKRWLTLYYAPAIHIEIKSWQLGWEKELKNCYVNGLKKAFLQPQMLTFLPKTHYTTFCHQAPLHFFSWSANIKQILNIALLIIAYLKFNCWKINIFIFKYNQKHFLWQRCEILWHISLNFVFLCRLIWEDIIFNRYEPQSVGGYSRLNLPSAVSMATNIISLNSKLRFYFSSHCWRQNAGGHISFCQYRCHHPTSMMG